MIQLEPLQENNPKLYWNLVNDLRDMRERDHKSSAVDPSTWVNHFKNLNEVKDNFKQRLSGLDKLLDRLQKENL